MSSLTLPFSQACERNKDPILEVIHPYWEHHKSVLEIGTGTAQHALYFAQSCKTLNWQPSDQACYLPGIKAQLANQPVANILAPIELDVCALPWPTPAPSYDMIYSANTLHIMPWTAVEAFFTGLGQVTHHGSILAVYGPFKFGGQFTSPSNQEFDHNLRARGEGSAIRDFEAVDDLAKAQGFKLLENHSMPANNQCLIWQREAQST